MKLTKKFWVLHQNGAILNKDYTEIQSGECNVGDGINAFESEEITEIERFIAENNLIIKDEATINNNPTIL